MDERWCPTCLRCGGAMEEGFLSGYGNTPLRWISGILEMNRWGVPANMRQRRKLGVQIYRCTDCGYLDLYARDEEAK